ncbi:pyridoxal phosphate-dependent transferase [Aspergillus novoparasiticus]|uniref:cystathionine gamma-lyase n=1 Tax=Aspergillus novoparasiticus TaxID=986946 RepID=A0A5N6ED45_9EURO|nr:pyridoxal phosphate-dependent transferase [Aspergillus novoparasiticus]
MANILDNCGNAGKMVWIETPSNPTLWLADIQAVADIAHESGSLLVDVLMGAIALQDPTIYKNLAFIQNAAGSVPKPLRLLACPPRCESPPSPLSPCIPERVYHRPDTGRFTSCPRRKPSRPVYASTVEAARRFCESSRLFTLAESLGGVERLCEVPAATTHCGMAKEVREEGGIFENLVRSSVGVENVEDLKVDLVWALEDAVAVELGRS